MTRVHDLLGKRYGTDFTIIDVKGEEVTLLMQGDYYKISAAELLVVIDRGLVSEIPERTRGRTP